MQPFDDVWRALMRGRYTPIRARPGVLLSRDSAGILEAHLAPHGRVLVPHTLVSVLQKK